MMCVYKITNPVGLVYVGKTTNYKMRLNQHRLSTAPTKIKDSLVKYGFNNHSFDVIKECLDENMLFKFECYYIGFYNSIEMGLNIKLPDTPSNLMIRTDSIFERKEIRYELSTHNNYVWTENDECFNLKTGIRIKQVSKNGMIGYCIKGKFISLKRLRPLLRKPITSDCPF